MRSRRPALGVLTVVLVLVAGLLALAPLGGGASATSGSAQARPGDVARTTAGRTVRYRVIDHNVERRDRAVATAVARAIRVKANAITLQEVCAWQADYLRERHPRWTVAFAADDRHGGCRDPRDDLDSEAALSGNAVILTGSARARRSRLVFARQIGGRAQNIVCLTHRAGFTRRICSTHLLASDTKLRKRIKANQAAQIRTHTSGWTRREDLVVIGGDFNASPVQRPMDFIYRFRGKGDFREATPRPAGDRRECRCRQRTFDGGRTKIDYIFFSANRMAEDAERRMFVKRTGSDHHLLDGWAMVSARR